MDLKHHEKDPKEPKLSKTIEAQGEEKEEREKKARLCHLPNRWSHYCTVLFPFWAVKQEYAHMKD